MCIVFVPVTALLFWFLLTSIVTCLHERRWRTYLKVCTERVDLVNRALVIGLVTTFSWFVRYRTPPSRYLPLVPCRLGNCVSRCCFRGHLIPGYSERGSDATQVSWGRRGWGLREPYCLGVRRRLSCTHSGNWYSFVLSRTILRGRKKWKTVSTLGTTGGAIVEESMEIFQRPCDRIVDGRCIRFSHRFL